MAHIDASLCDRSTSCCVERICPRNAVVPDTDLEVPADPPRGLARFKGMLGKGRPYGWKVDEDRCSGCLLCAQYCPHRAVVPKERGVAA